MVRVSFLKEDKEDKIGSGKPKEVKKTENIIEVSLPLDPNDDIPFKPEPFIIHKKEEKNPFIFNKDEIDKMIIFTQSHITRYSESKRAQSQQTQDLWTQAVEFKESLLKRLIKIKKIQEVD